MQGLFRNAQFRRSQLHAIKTLGVINQRRVAACAHLADDRRHLTYKSVVEGYVAIADCLQPGCKSLCFMTLNNLDHTQAPSTTLILELRTVGASLRGCPSAAQPGAPTKGRPYTIS